MNGADLEASLKTLDVSSLDEARRIVNEGEPDFKEKFAQWVRWSNAQHLLTGYSWGVAINKDSA